MEVVNRLPRPADPAALQRLVAAQQILCARALSEEDIQQAESILLDLATPESEGGFGYYPALLTLASLYGHGFEPGITKNETRAAAFYLQLFVNDSALSMLGPELLEDASTELCNIVRNGKSGFGERERMALEGVCERLPAAAAAFLRFALLDLERLLREASEDDETRERRLAREAARAEAREAEVARQRALAESVLKDAEQVRQEGNDFTRQGQLPGNANASKLLARAAQLYASGINSLTDCLPELSFVPEERIAVQKERGLLLANAAQVNVQLKNWQEVRRLAKESLVDVPGNFKASYRLAKAEVGLANYEAAATVIDEALRRIQDFRGAEQQAMRSELWQLAEEVSRALPGYKWSASKPAESQADDYERRICGTWGYQLGSMFVIKLEPWGALVFLEESMKIDLMRKSKLRWRGELELISGMVLHLSYEPGADMMMTEWEVPADIPAEQRWQGPTKFTSKRVGHAPGKEAPITSQDLLPTPTEPKLEQVPSLSTPEGTNESALAEAISAAEALREAPRQLWLRCGEGSVCKELEGCYELNEAETQNGRPAYRRRPFVGVEDREDRELYLWYRGGNWGVTERLHASSLVAPFLLRCPDQRCTSRQLLDLRRPRWHVRSGRGQETLCKELQVSAEEVCADSAIVGDHNKAHSCADSAPAEHSGDVPRLVELSGRWGPHAEVNGKYQLCVGTLWNGLPVYRQIQEDSNAPSFWMFYDRSLWVVGLDLQKMPRSVARRRVSSAAEFPHPAVSRENSPWEFLQSNDAVGHMVSTETRVYVPDRAVVVLPLDVSSSDVPFPIEGSAVVEGCSVVVPREMIAQARESSPKIVCGDSAAMELWPAWVQNASAELCNREVKVSVLIREGVSVDVRSLRLEAASDCLKLTFQGREGTLELRLPADVDAEADLAAKWSERTRSLKVRLMLQCNGAAVAG